MLVASKFLNACYCWLLLLRTVLILQASGPWVTDRRGWTTCWLLWTRRWPSWTTWTSSAKSFKSSDVGCYYYWSAIKIQYNTIRVLSRISGGEIPAENGAEPKWELLFYHFLSFSHTKLGFEFVWKVDRNDSCSPGENSLSISFCQLLIDHFWWEFVWKSDRNDSHFSVRFSIKLLFISIIWLAGNLCCFALHLHVDR